MVDVELYGGRRGFFEHIRTSILGVIGGYRDARHVEFATVQRLVFVCKGNICRSPYASMKARSLGANTMSCGLEATDGAIADIDASRNALVRGIDLSAHRALKAARQTINVGDLLLVFEPSHLHEVIRRFGADAQVTLLGFWIRPTHLHIHDPYGRSDRYFQQCFSLIDEGIANLTGRLTGKCMIAEPRSNRNILSGVGGSRIPGSGVRE